MRTAGNQQGLFVKGLRGKQKLLWCTVGRLLPSLYFSCDHQQDIVSLQGFCAINSAPPSRSVCVNLRKISQMHSVPVSLSHKESNSKEAARSCYPSLYGICIWQPDMNVSREFNFLDQRSLTLTVFPWKTVLLIILVITSSILPILVGVRLSFPQFCCTTSWSSKLHPSVRFLGK